MMNKKIPGNSDTLISPIGYNYSMEEKNILKFLKEMEFTELQIKAVRSHTGELSR